MKSQERVELYIFERGVGGADEVWLSLSLRARALKRSGRTISPLCHCEPASGGRGNLAFKNKKDE
jgi:hypothetical protein